MNKQIIFVMLVFIYTVVCGILIADCQIGVMAGGDRPIILNRALQDVVIKVMNFKT